MPETQSQSFDCAHRTAHHCFAEKCRCRPAIETVAVKLGLETDLLIQIIGDDIQEGDQLVLNGEDLADGTLVSVSVI